MRHEMIKSKKVSRENKLTKKIVDFFFIIVVYLFGQANFI